MNNKNESVNEKVQQINQIETALTEFNAKRALSEVDTNLQIISRGECTLLIDTNKPGSVYYNRIKGFGASELEHIEEILEIYTTKGITPCFDLTPDQMNPEVSEALMEKGYVYSDQLVFLEIKTKPTNGHDKGIKIVKVDKNNVDEFLKLLSMSIEMEIGPELAERKSPYFYDDHFQNYIAYIGNEAAGMGSLFIEGDKGYIANDFTFESFRGKGVQKALLDFRIQVAYEMGLTKVFTDVEFGSISHNNMLKYGFETVFLNSFWFQK